MRTYLSILFLLGIIYSSHGQELRCKVIAPSGMNVRAEPSLNANVVDRVMKDSIVYIHAKTYGELTFDGLPGYWRKMSRAGHQGYIWDGYLDILESVDITKDEATKDTLPEETKDEKTVEPKPTATKSQTDNELVLLLETYNHCGDVSHINPNAFWYALIPDKETVNVEAVELSVNLSRSRLSKSMEFDIQTNNNNRSLFLIGSEKTLNIPNVFKNLEHELRAGGRQVLPGQRRMLSDDIFLSALGNVRDINDECPMIDNYQLTAHAFGDKQDILTLFDNLGECGVPELYWFGDLNGNGIPSLIFVTVSSTSNVFHLLDYAEHNGKEAYRVISTFEMTECID